MVSIFTELDAEWGGKFWTRNHLEGYRKIVDSSPEAHKGELYIKREENIYILRYLVLLNETLTFHKVKTKESKKDLRIIKQTNVRWKVIEPFIETTSKKILYGFRLTGYENHQDFYTENEESLLEWINALEHHVINKDFEDHFSVIREIGRGKFAEVYECKNRFSSERFAAKQISKTLLEVSPENREKLITEINRLKFFRHELIANLIGLYENENFVYLVLELGEGGDLQKKVLRNGKYTEIQTEKIIKQLLKGVHLLHRSGYAHREIRAEHIVLISRNNEHRIKLLSLGHSCSISEADQRTGEYFVDMDIFSIGVIMFILMSGEYSFSITSMEDAMRRLQLERIEQKMSWWNKITNEAKDLMNWLTHSDPLERPNAKEAEIHPWICENIQTSAVTPGLDSRSEEPNEKLKESLEFIKKELPLESFSKFCERLGLNEEEFEEGEEKSFLEDTIGPSMPSEKMPGSVFLTTNLLF